MTTDLILIFPRGVSNNIIVRLVANGRPSSSAKASSHPSVYLSIFNDDDCPGRDSTTQKVPPSQQPGPTTTMEGLALVVRTFLNENLK